jgi:polyhydroxybutyrate depolymerase
MSGRAVLCLVLTLTFTIASCGGSAATSATRPSASPVENCRGLTGRTSPDPTIQSVSLTVDGKLREYRVFRPPALDSTKPVALVVVLHGAGQDAAGFETITQFDDEATTAGFIAAYPNGCRQIWQYAGGGSKLADLHFITKMLDRLETEFRIDPARIFVVGFSAGAFMSYRLACDMSSRVTGIVSVGGSMFADECKPTRPVSILEMHGTDDTLVPWQGGATTNPVDTVIQRWRTIDGCVGGPILSQNGLSKTSVWSHCASGTTVRLDAVQGGYHAWFGAVPGEPKANAVIWSFLSKLPPNR